MKCDYVTRAWIEMTRHVGIDELDEYIEKLLKWPNLKRKLEELEKHYKEQGYPEQLSSLDSEAPDGETEKN